MSKQLPRELRPLFEAVWKEVVSAHALWLIFCQLYVDEPQAGLILRETAPGFFGSIRSVVRNSVILAISRLSDSSTSGNYRNASLETLRNIIAETDNSHLLNKLDEILARLKSEAKPLRDGRHKALAHTDLPTALRERPNPLPGISKEVVDAALHEVRSFMNAVELYYTDATTAFEHVIQEGGAKTLLCWLDAGLELEDNERERDGLPRKYTWRASDARPRTSSLSWRA